MINANNSSPTRQVNHDWSWDALRTTLADAYFDASIGRFSIPQFIGTDCDISLCTNTELLNIVVSCFANHPYFLNCHPYWQGSWRANLLRWVFYEQHHKLLSAVILSQEKRLSKAFSRSLLRNIGELLRLARCIDYSQVRTMEAEMLEGYRMILTALKMRLLRFSAKHAIKILKEILQFASPTLTRALIESSGKLNHQRCLDREKGIFLTAIISGNMGVAKAVLEYGARPQQISHLADMSNDLVWHEVFIQNQERQQRPDAHTYDIELDPFTDVKRMHAEKPSAFTCLEFCAFHSPSLCRTLQDHLPDFGRSQVTQLLIAATEQLHPPSGISMLAKEMTLFGAAEFNKGSGGR